MIPSILLLDCSSNLTEKLKRQGFDVDSGTIGFCNGIRRLPCPIYEKEVLIYNPSSVARKAGVYIRINDITDFTPDHSLDDLLTHIYRGAIFLVFVNRVADDAYIQNRTYSWIPSMPQILFTKDYKPLPCKLESKYNHFAPIVSPSDLKIPVLQKIPPQKISQHGISLFINRNNDILGFLFEMAKGQLIVLPEYKSNEEVISVFLHRVIPKIHGLKTRIDFIDQFSSPEEAKVKGEIEKIENDIKTLNGNLELAKERLASATRSKIQTIKGNETAALIINYYDTATQQEDVALFYLYKVIEALEKKYDGEANTKSVLGCNAEWNLIEKTANASYADIRHAPRPGEKIKEWSQEEIKACFEAAKKIINVYLSKLF